MVPFSKSCSLLLLAVVMLQCSHGYDCPKKMQIAHGYIDFENLNEDKGEVPVKCSNGYSADPHDMIFCRADGSWSPVVCKPKGCDCPNCDGSCNTWFCWPRAQYDEEYMFQESGADWNCPSCTRDYCKSSKKISHGKINYKDHTTYGAMVTVSCDTGYKLTGHPHLICLSTGKWTANTTCELRDCGPHHNITNGFVEFKGGDTTYGKEYAVKCDKGYNLKGDEKIRCQGDGTWSKASVCLPIDCGTDFQLDNGYAMFHDKKTTYKSKVNVGCNAGFNMRGNDFITCNENGTWTNDTECIIKHCPSDYTISHSSANFTGRKTSYGTVIPVSCESGYEVKGEHYALCQKDGKWSGTKCEPKDCGTDYKIENGKVDFAKRNTKYKAQVPVTCNGGYKIKGDSHITCGSSGKWSVHTLCSIKSCGTVYELDHGYVDFAGKSTKYKAKVEVTCDDGYEIDGEDEIECGKDGKWTRTSCTGGLFGKNSTLIWVFIGVGAFLLILIIVLVVMRLNRILCFA